MPLRRYFGFVGSALLLLLFGLDWYLPQPVVEPVRAVTDKPVIRISSIEKLPERVVIDTSLPTIVPPPTALEFAERWPEEIKVVEAKPLPGATTLNAGGGAPKPKKLARSEPLKKVAARRPTAPPMLMPCHIRRLRGRRSRSWSPATWDPSGGQDRGCCCTALRTARRRFSVARGLGT